MTLRKKLTGLVLFIIVGFAIVTGSTFMVMSNLQELSNLINQSQIVITKFEQFSSLSKDLLFTGNLRRSYDEWNDSSENFKSYFNDFLNSPSLKKALRNVGEDDLIISLQSHWEAVQSPSTRLDAAIEKLLTLYEPESTFVTGLLTGYEKFGDFLFISATSTIDTVINANKLYSTKLLDVIDLLTESIAEIQKKLIILTITITAAVSIFLIVFFLLFSSRLVKRLGSIDSFMKKLQEKDFTVKMNITGKDELSIISHTINEFIDNFSNVIRGVKGISAESSNLKNEVLNASTESATAINEVSANISSISGKIKNFVEYLKSSNAELENILDGVSGLSLKIEGQANLVNSSVSAMDQINGTIQNIAEIAEKRTETVNNLVHATREGGKVIDTTAVSVQEISTGLEEIGVIIDIINDISSQTNLLAMNAAIQAAHAGNAGKGFTVVALEIRKLADATQNNAKIITGMVEAISTKITEVLGMSQNSKKSFGIVAHEVDVTTSAMNEISSSILDLASGSSEVMNSIDELSIISKELDKETNNMRTHTESVVNDVKEIGDLSLEIKLGMEEIEIAANEINTFISYVNELQIKNGIIIEEVFHEISDFHT